MSEIADMEGDDRHPYGPGSHAPLSEVSEMPACHPIKGNVRADGRRLYHRPDSRRYTSTTAEIWFDSPSAAEEAGFVLATTHPARSSGDDYEPGGSGHPCSAADVEANRAAVAGLAAAATGDDAPEATDEVAVGDVVEEQAVNPLVSAGAVAEGDDLELGRQAHDDALHPYGVGSRAALEDPLEMPPLYPIKGKRSRNRSRLYHRPDSSSYRVTQAEVWFDSPSAAEAAGFRMARTHPRASSTDDFEPGGAKHGWSVEEVRQERLRAFYGPGGPPAMATAGHDETTPDSQRDDDRDDERSAAVGAAAAGAAITIGGARLISDGEDEADAAEDAAAAGGPGVADVDDVDEGVEEVDTAAEEPVEADEPAPASDAADTVEVAPLAAGGAALAGLNGSTEPVTDPAAGTVEVPAATVAEARAADDDLVSASPGSVGDDAGAAVDSPDSDDATLAAGAGAAAAAATAARTGEVPAAGGRFGGRRLAGRSGSSRILVLALAVLVLLILFVLLLSQCGGDDEELGSAGDGLEAQALEALEEAGYADLEPALDGDAITLRGQVASEEDGEAAMAALADLDGVATVENELTVAGTADADATEDDAAEDDAAEDDAAEDDADDLEARALAALDEAGYGELTVDADGDVLTLRGAVASEDEGEAAMAAVADLEGVASVENELTMADTPAGDETAGDDTADEDDETPVAEPLDDDPRLTG